MKDLALGPHPLKVTNLDKVLIPAKRPHKVVTKRDLIRHYATIAPASSRRPPSSEGSGPAQILFGDLARSSLSSCQHRGE